MSLSDWQDRQRKIRRHLFLEQLEDRRLFAGDLKTPAPPPLPGNTPPVQVGKSSPQPPAVPAPPTTGTNDVRSIDGTGNNLQNPNFGSAGIDLLRIAPAAYADGKSAPTAGQPERPSARVISNTLSDQQEDIVNSNGLSAMAYAWGQFLDHDMDLTTSASPTEKFNIAVPKGDPEFDPLGTGTQVILLTRSLYDTNTGTTNARQQVNTITAWIDGSMVYGSDITTADKLRTLSGGKMKTSDGDMLPINNTATFPTGPLNMANASPVISSDQLYAAGDERANENVELTSLHTIFVREHNRIADQIAKNNPGLSDEQIYQRARAVVIGEIQAITYNEWIPALLGPRGIQPYKGYNPAVNPGIANEFSTAAFRFGHSLLGDDIKFLGDDGIAVADEISLAEGFFNPPMVEGNGVDSILKYLTADPASELDTKVVDSVRNFLFGPPGAGGLDLASLNIQRGREHGLADYNATRQAYGLPKVKDFSDITSNSETQEKLRQLYGNVNNIDLWVGALAEDHVPQGSVGPTLQKIIGDQFERLRAGDRFWYQRAFFGKELDAINNTKLSDVIRRNTELKNLQDNVFFFRVGISGQVFHDANANGRLDGKEQGVAGRTVQLVNAVSGEVEAETRTDARGQYRFDTSNGLEAGRFRVVEVLPGGWSQTTRDPAEIAISRGEVFATNVNFGTSQRPATINAALTDAVFAQGVDSNGDRAVANLGNQPLPPSQSATVSSPPASANQSSTATPQVIPTKKSGGTTNDDALIRSPVSALPPPLDVPPVGAALPAKKSK